MPTTSESMFIENERLTVFSASESMFIEKERLTVFSAVVRHTAQHVAVQCLGKECVALLGK